MELEGAVAVVTGASAGIGRGTARAFAAAGADVVLAARRLDRLEEVASEIERRGRRALAVRCDVSRPEDLETLRDRTIEEMGRVDILVNNAGIPGGGDFTALPMEKIDEVIRTNLLSVLWGTRLFLPSMLKQGRGHVVNVASLAGRYAVPGGSVYSAAKHGVVGFSESLNSTSSPKGVLVTTVNPALVHTESFPATNRPRLLTFTPEHVAAVMVKVVRQGIAPEISIPRWAASGQVIRLLAPPLYRWAVATGERLSSSAGSPSSGKPVPTPNRDASP
jgi:short-subunit dehydrogenase